MSGEVYDIAKRAVHAYINTGSIPQYVATQVDRDVTELMGKKMREAQAAAWDEGQRAWEDELLGRATGRNPYRR